MMHLPTEVERMAKRLKREKMARAEAERLLEAKSLALYKAFRQLEEEAQNLESTVNQRTQELQSALEQAQAAARSKSAFLATMSHELRTPLNGVLAVSELLLRSGLDEEQSHWVQTIANSGQNLLVLLNEILDFSKIEAQQLRLEHAVFSPEKTLTDVCEMFSAQARVKGLQLHCSSAPDLPKAVWGDSTRVKQIWANLIGNALKFTDKGSVGARLWVTPTASGVRLHGEVTDTGIGIPSELKQRIFQPFVQADSSTTRKFGGTGLGLAITRRILDLMGGDIALDSVAGAGASFRFSWPAVCAAADELVGPVPHHETHALPSLRLLLAEDNPVNAKVVLALLKALGQTEVIWAVDGNAALAHLQQQTFDVVLMDVQMPDLDGLQVTQRLRTLPLVKQPWVIALTANVFPEDREACVLAGMNDFLSKPISMGDLQQALGRSQQR
jgi:two-component system, sensor histidine kinase